MLLLVTIKTEHHEKATFNLSGNSAITGTWTSWKNLSCNTNCDVKCRIANFTFYNG